MVIARGGVSVSGARDAAACIAGAKAAAELSAKCHSVIRSALTFEQLAVADRYASLVVAACERRRLPVTFNFRGAVRDQRRRIESGLV